MVWNRLFAKNPFAPMREHMAKTLECVELLNPLLEALSAGDQSAVLEHAKALSKAEREADEIKHKIRARLTKSILLPVDRRDLLEMLHNMDSIADQSEDVGVILTLREMTLHDSLKEPYLELFERVRKVVNEAATVVVHLDAILEQGLSESEIDKLIDAVDSVGALEHDADKAQDIFGKQLFSIEDELKPAELFMWIKLANKMGDIANAAERMCNNIRTMVTS